MQKSILILACLAFSTTACGALKLQMGGGLVTTNGATAGGTNGSTGVADVDYWKAPPEDIAKMKLRELTGELHTIEKTELDDNGRTRGTAKSAFPYGNAASEYEQVWRKRFFEMYPDKENKARIARAAASAEVKDGTPPLELAGYQFTTLVEDLAELDWAASVLKKDEPLVAAPRDKVLRMGGNVTHGEMSTTNYPGYVQVRIDQKLPMKEWRRATLRYAIAYAKAHGSPVASELETALAATPAKRCVARPWVAMREREYAGQYAKQITISRSFGVHDERRTKFELLDCKSVPKTTDKEIFETAKSDKEDFGDVVAVAPFEKGEWHLVRNEFGTVLRKEIVVSIYTREEY